MPSGGTYPTGMSNRTFPETPCHRWGPLGATGPQTLAANQRSHALLCFVASQEGGIRPSDVQGCIASQYLHAQVAWTSYSAASS